MRKTLMALLLMALLATACGSEETGASAPQDSAPQDSAAEDSAAEDSAADSPADGPTDETDGQSPAGFSLNGFRYCEVLMTVPGDDGTPVTEVWGTPGVGPCEDDAWNAIDPDALVAEFGATWILMNGPRHFVVDGSVDTAPADSDAAAPAGEVRNFGSVPMRLLATVDETSGRSVAYRPELVVRTTTWTFDTGTEVYELIDPDGNTYVMQSYALIHDPDLTAENLSALGDRLDLPEGWSYQSRILDEDLQVALTPEGAIVVQDELANSYQRT